MDFWNITAADICTLIIAISSILLSNKVYRDNIKARQPDIKVSISHGASINTLPVSHCLYLKAANAGTRRVELNSFGLKLPNGNILFDPGYKGNNFPGFIEEGASSTVTMKMSSLADELLKTMEEEDAITVTGYFEDSLDNKYFSAPYKFEKSGLIRIISERGEFDKLYGEYPNE